MKDGRSVVRKTLGEGKLDRDLLDEDVFKDIPRTQNLRNYTHYSTASLTVVKVRMKISQRNLSDSITGGLQ